MGRHLVWQWSYQGLLCLGPGPDGESHRHWKPAIPHWLDFRHGRRQWSLQWQVWRTNRHGLPLIRWAWRSAPLWRPDAVGPVSPKRPLMVLIVQSRRVVWDLDGCLEPWQVQGWARVASSFALALLVNQTWWYLGRRCFDRLLQLARKKLSSLSRFWHLPRYFPRRSFWTLPKGIRW